MQRLVNWAVAAWIFYPNKIILTTKLNVKDAFHHCHLNALIAIQTCTQLPSEGLGLMMIRLTFVGGGGDPPALRNGDPFAESIYDLANAILLRRIAIN
jgi:hypothetical protein